MTTKSDKTIIGFLGDESGSMGGLQQPMVDGFNEFVGNVRKDAADKEVRVVLGFFDATGGEPILRIKRDEDLASCRELSRSDYNPRGGTPLNDATIEMIGRMEHSAEGAKKKMLVVFTDGQENSSTEDKDGSKVRALIRDKEADGWEFIYLGANQDAWEEGTSRGVAGNRSYNTVTSPQGMRAMSSSMSQLASSYVADSADEYAAKADKLHATTGGNIKEDS